MQIKLRGLPEGLIGKSEIEVESRDITGKKTCRSGINSAKPGCTMRLSP